MPDFIKRFTSRAFLLTLGSTLAAVGAGVSAAANHDLPPDQKVQAIFAALGAVVLLVTNFTHAETKKDGIIAAANIAADAVVNAPAPDIAGLVKAELVSHLADSVNNRLSSVRTRSDDPEQLNP